MAQSNKHIALLLASYLLLGSLLPQMDFSQLTRLSTLQSHYLHHQEEAEELGESCSLAHFLYEHFIDFSAHEGPEHKDCHQDMPLNGINTTISFCLSLSFQAITFDYFKRAAEAPALEAASPLPGYLSGIFQPPTFG